MTRLLNVFSPLRIVVDYFAGTYVGLFFKAVAQNQSENEQLNALQAKTTFSHLFHPFLEAWNLQGILKILQRLRVCQIYNIPSSRDNHTIITTAISIK